MRGIGRIQSAIRSFRLAHVHRSALESQPPDVAELIDGIVTRYHAIGGLSHPYQRYKLLCLYRLLNDRKPTEIIEFGSGSTTPIFADFVRRNPNARLTVVDESADWLERSGELAGLSEADERVRCLHCPRVVSEGTDGLAIKHDFTPDRDFDFVFVDGPSLDVDGRTRKDAVNTNVFDLVARFPPSTIVVSVRRATAKACASRLVPQYDAELSDLFSGRIERGYNYFSVFKRG